MVTAALVAGCGHGPEDAPSTPEPAISGTPQMSDLQTPPQRLVIDATIKGGELIGADKQSKVTINETIVVRISSDADDELHVNSSPEHTFTVAAKPNQSFQFSIGAPGSFTITLKKLNRTLATILVR